MGLFGKLLGSGAKKQESVMEKRGSGSEPSIARDPVCAMNVNVKTATAKSDYQGKTYYFCAPACKQQFDNDPARYAAGQASGGHGRQNSSCCH